MRTLSTFLFIAIFGIESYNTHVAIAHSTIGAVHPIQITGQKQHSRSLRQYIANESSSDKEERGAVDKVDDIVTKLDGAVDKAKLITPKLDYMIMKNLGEFSREALVQKLSSKYSGAAKLSYSTLKQLDEVEKLRVGDIATYSKENGRSMHKEIPDFVGIKRAPEKYMESHVGREKQLFGEDGSRFLSCGVVLKPMDQGDKMLLISPSNPNKGDWLLPKGGWDEGEEIEVAALREVMEEGGMTN
ncbi:RxLR effector protein [Phytophthora megakarya]|uniref:RxLR effector protein n=1 Tax=Phytophthora megakarya TaxID=4795 RepID=A0A225VR08_9STRA|nr:RxLR effector protein [Phytophthora megakarya]